MPGSLIWKEGSTIYKDASNAKLQKKKNRAPLIPSNTPPYVWTILDADHWEPTDDGNYILVVVDETTRYARAAVVSQTSPEPNIAAFDKIFSTHGYPEKLKIDG